MGRSLDDVRRKHGLQSAPTSEPLDEEGYTVTREMLEAWGVGIDKVQPPEADLQAAEEQAMAARQRQYEKALAEQPPQPVAVEVQPAQQNEVVGALLQQNQQLMSQVAELTNQVIALTNQMRSITPQANIGPKHIKRASNMSDEEKWRVMQSGDGLLG